MSKFSRFMKCNKIERKNGMYAPTRSLRDEEGKALEWEFRHITSREIENIREDCTIEVPVTGKPNMYRQKLKAGLYIQKMITASVVMPDLYDAQLQDSYGVKTPEELLLAMVDDPGEYNELAAFVQNFQGFNVSFEDKVEEAKKLIEEGDWEANFAYYALLKLHILPSVFLEMDEQEKAFTVAAIKVKMKNDRKREKEMKRKGSRGKKGR